MDNRLVGERFKQFRPHKSDVVQPAPALELAVRHRGMWRASRVGMSLPGAGQTLCLLRISACRARQQIKHHRNGDRQRAASKETRHTAEVSQRIYHTLFNQTDPLKFTWRLFGST